MRDSMPLKIALQMDPVESIHIDKDSTFALALEAQTRGHTLFYYPPQALSLEGEKLKARGHSVRFRRQMGAHFTLGAEETRDLGEMDVILMRQDPPFDMAYITATFLLERLPPSVRVINNPAGVRNCPEKLFILDFPQFLPPTLISRDRAAIEAFRAHHKDIVLKPLFAAGGEGVFHLAPGDRNLSALLEMLAKHHREPFMVQRYIPEVVEGDKRIILIDGEPAGAVLRVPASGETRSNFHAGGSPAKTTLTARDKEICAALEPELKKRGLFFTGIDVIGGYLTEINVTSPTGIQEINLLDGVSLEKLFWDKVESQLT